MATATSAAMKTAGLPQFINATSEDAPRLLQTAATGMSKMPATATNGALLPATTTTMVAAATTTAAMTTADIMTASAGTLLPTTTGVARRDDAPNFPTMAPGLLQTPQQYPVYFLPHPVFNFKVKLTRQQSKMSRIHLNNKIAIVRTTKSRLSCNGVTMAMATAASANNQP
jgi:hypothetical protein